MRMKLLANNKKAYHDYFIEEKYEAGLALIGSEVKSIKKGKVSIKEAFVSDLSGEMYVYGMHVTPYKEGYDQNIDPLRRRKLLLHKKEMSLDGTKEPSEIVSEGQEIDVIITSIEKADRKMSFSIKPFLN